jgi:hypothetical protein
MRKLLIFNCLYQTPPQYIQQKMALFAKSRAIFYVMYYPKIAQFPNKLPQYVLPPTPSVFYSFFDAH